MQRHRPTALALAAALATLGFAPPTAPVQGAVTARLPDLAALPPFDFKIQVTGSGKRLLRFSTVVVNIGDGPFQLYGYDSDGVAAIGDHLHVRQQILQTDGSYLAHNTTATMAWAADGHNHFHIKDLQQFKLEDLHGTTLRRVAKTGFCFRDSYWYGSIRPSRYNTANSVCVVDANKIVPMGLSVRWGDIYKSTIAFQWIDISGLASGDYLLRIVADPPWQTGGRFRESNESNNRSWAKIHLTKSTVTVLSKSATP